MPESQFRIILDSAPTAMVMVNQNGTITLVNSETEKLFGYDRSELEEQPLELLIPKRFQENHPAHRQQFFHAPETRRMGVGRDLFAQRKDGTEFPVEIGLNPVEIEGKMFVLSVIADITQRKKLELEQKKLNDDLQQRTESLSKAESLFRITLDSAPTAMVMVNNVGVIVLVNVETEKLFGYSREEMLNKPMEILLPDRFCAQHPDHRKSFFSKPETRRMGAGRDLFAQRKDGTEFPVEIGLNPVEIDGETFVLSAIADISERKKLEAAQNRLNENLSRQTEALSKAEALFRITLDSAPTAMVMVNNVGNIVLVNSETEKLFGFNRDEMLEHPLEILIPNRFRAHHPNHRNDFFSKPETRRMGVGRDLFAQRKDGTEFPVEIGLNPVEIEGETFVLSAIADITKRKKLEDAQRQLNDELERRVSERTEELAKSNDKLVKSNIDLQQYAFIASHDLQTPLRGIAGFARMLQEEYCDQLDEDANFYIERIVGGSKRLQLLIRDLLAYSKLDSQTSRFVDVSMNSVFEDALMLLGGLIGETGGKVIREELPTIRGDASQLSHLLQNLIGNGLKYCKERASLVKVSVKTVDGYWQFSIEDNGIGISEENQEKVFEIFRRLHTQKEYSGTGIGLALCKKIVEQHDGKIWLTSKENIGTTFFFMIPQNSNR